MKYMFEKNIHTYSKKNMFTVVGVIGILTVLLVGRLVFLMVKKANYYGDGAIEVRERERKIKAPRGCIYDRNGIVLASNKSVCTISVIHNQIKEPEKVIDILSDKLGISEEDVRKRVEKISSIEKIKANVDKELADEIRNMNLDGVMVDEDYKRIYPYGDLASKVIGFTGADNQGIVGLEVKYNKELAGKEGRILTTTTASGIELDKEAERRIESEEGYNLRLTLDYNIQKYAHYLSNKVLEEKEAKNVRMVIMNPKNGEIYAMVGTPEYDLNKPYVYNGDSVLYENASSKEKNNMLNEMWRNMLVSDTYEPGSTFKIVTATAAFEEGLLNIEDRFHCPGFCVVADRRIRCHKVGGHGSENFRDGIMNSCNPVFINVGLRLSPTKMYEYYERLGLFRKTGIDIPGEASSIMHKLENIKTVEQATMSFGQSIQITPMQLLVAVSAIVNGGEIVTPHFVSAIETSDNKLVKKLVYVNKKEIISVETCEKMKDLLESVVAEGTGNKAFVEGIRIGGKTATSEKLPRRTGKYIASFMGFMPADDPEIIAMVMIDEPKGIYYGGTIAAPVIGSVFKNIANNGNSGLIMLE